jgi:Ca2+/Na+ antiporter
MSEFKMKMKNFITLLGILTIAILIYAWHVGTSSALEIAAALVIVIVVVMVYYSRKNPNSVVI